MKQFRCTMEVPEGVKINPCWGSLLHGAVMEKCPKDIADELHSSNIKPWSQYIMFNKEGRPQWVVNALTDKMAEVFELYIFNTIPSEWRIEHKNSVIKMRDLEITQSIDFKSLSDRFFLSDSVSRQHNIIFKTPTSFKKDGQHVIFPSSDLIFNSLAQKWDAVSPHLKVSDDDVRMHLAQHVYIKKYKLSSTMFSVDGSWIKGFSGYIEFGVKGPESLARLVSLLLCFSEFSGVGVKTALGMGGVIYGA